MKTYLASLLILVLSLCPFLLAEDEPAPASLSAECDGESRADLEKHQLELDRNVRVKWGDLGLKCGWLLVQLADDDRTPVSLVARGFAKEAEEREKATGRIEADWGGYSFRCRELTLSFASGQFVPASVEARSDVWMKLAEQGYFLHASAVDLKRDAETGAITVDISSDAALPRAEVGGPGFVASETEGSLAVNGKSVLHTAQNIEIIYELLAGDTILPADIAKASNGKLTVTAGRAKLDSSAGSYEFSQGTVLSLGELRLEGPTAVVECVAGTTQPKKLTVAGQTEADAKAARLIYKGLSVNAQKLTAELEDRKTASFTADGAVRIVVLDSDDQTVTAQCARAEYREDSVTLTAAEGGKVVVTYPSQGIRITETRGVFTRGPSNRWSHTGYESKTEYIPKE